MKKEVLAEEIEIGIAVGEVNTETIRVTTDMVKKNMANMSGYQAQEKFAALQRSLHLPVVVTPGVGFAEYDPSQPAFPPYPVDPAQPQPSTQPTFWQRLTGKRKVPMKVISNEQTIVDAPKLKSNLPPGPQDIALAKSINPLVAPFRDCPNCHDKVPLTFPHCLACGHEMKPISIPQLKDESQPQEGPKADSAPFPGD